MLQLKEVSVASVARAALESSNPVVSYAITIVVEITFIAINGGLLMC